MSDRQDSQLDYYFDFTVGPDRLAALEVIKTWVADDQRQFDTFTVAKYDRYDEAAADERALAQVQHDHGLEMAMNVAEGLAVASGFLDPRRSDPHLFKHGPPDPFTTIRQQSLERKHERATKGHAWQLDTLPVRTPEGEPLGYTVQMVTGPSVGGNAPPLPDEPVWMMDVAHFDRAEQAAQFTEEFHQYVVPGLLDGPDLAAEIARLEGLPAQQHLLQGPEMDDYLNGELTLTRDPADWHPYNPNAEREARIEAEGLYTDPIQQFTKLDESANESQIKSVSSSIRDL